MSACGSYDVDDLSRKIAERNRMWRENPKAWVRALLASDLEQLKAIELDRSLKGWRRAFLQVARLPAIPDDMKPIMLTAWLRHGDHIRQEVGDDLVLAKALRVLLPIYSGPTLTLYRGDSAWNRRRRTYGLSWTSSAGVAEDFAACDLWRSHQGGSVLLKGEVPPEAIIAAPALLDNGYGEDEYLVDRRYLRGRVKVVKRFSELPLTMLSAGC